MSLRQSRTAAVAALAVAVLSVAGLADAQSADGVSEAQAGQVAFDRGDNAEAVNRFTAALLNPGLAQADRELAYVRRGQAYLGLGRKDLALADAIKALEIDAADADAAAVRDKSQASDGPSLEATLAYIKDKLESQGAMNWAIFGHEGSTNEDYTNTVQAKYSVAPDPAHCTLTFSARTGEQVTRDLKKFKAFAVLPATEFYSRANAEAGKPDQIVNATNPVMFVVFGDTGSFADSGGYFFKDEDTANRVARAFVHVMELCGGGKKEKSPELF